MLRLGTISLDGTKIHAAASKSTAVSYERLLMIEAQLRVEVEALFVLAARADQRAVPDGMVVAHEVALRQARLTRLAEAKAALTARSHERDVGEQAAYQARRRERAASAERTGRPPRERPPLPPTPGPRAGDQYHVTDPTARIMKNSTNQGFDQQYNAQVAVDQASLLIVGYRLSNHANDQAEAIPTVEAIPAVVGRPLAVALDTGYFSERNIDALVMRGIEPSIATGRAPHQQGWQAYFAAQSTPPSADASPREQMAYKLQTTTGKAMYRLRKCTVAPVFGIIKAVLGFRQFSLRGAATVADEWGLVCLAFNLKRLHVLRLG